MGQSKFVDCPNGGESNENPSTATIYHIYHTGWGNKCYSIHTVSDRNTILRQPTTDTKKDDSLEKETGGPYEYLGHVTGPQDTPTERPKKISRFRALDNPKYDPRTETAPYYLHLPTLYGHAPPFTLRHGGTKTAPTACLIHSSWAWQNWKLEFGDILAQDGVVDGRGVVGLRYGTKSGEDGTLKGYDVRKRRWLGESGKEWHKLQKTVLQDAAEPAMKAKPEEVVQVTWPSPFSFHARQYNFSWRNFCFIWKGTSKIQPKKFCGPFVRFNHLKLVVVLPGKGILSSGQDIESTELCLARFTSVIGKRKSGRLEVFYDVIDTFVCDNMDAIDHAEEERVIKSLDSSKGHLGEKCSDKARSLQLGEVSKIHQRMRDVVVATAMCMIIGEWQKRQVIIQTILLLLNAAG